MRTTIVIFAAVGILCAGAAHASSAGSIPAGTAITVKTTDTISSNAAPGTRFGAVLARDFKGAPPRGIFTGKVVSSKRMQSSKERLMVDLVEVAIDGKKHHLKTTGPVSLESYTSSRGVSLSGEHYQVARGRKLTFKLAQPLNL